MTLFQCMIVAAILTGLFCAGKWIVNFTQLCILHVSCIRIAVWTQFVMNCNSCRIQKEGVTVTYPTYFAPDKFVRHFRIPTKDLLSTKELGAWIEELLEGEVIIPPKNKEQTFVPSFQKDRLLKILEDLLVVIDYGIKEYSYQDSLGKYMLKEYYKTLNFLQEELVKESHSIGQKAEEVICFFPGE